MSTALYRRYRPETFTEVIGQEHVTGPLMQALRTGRITHAYLFSGPRGCGKTTSARILARTLNCARSTPENPLDTPCGECPSCIELSRDGSGSLDVVEIDAASHNGVDDARDLRERAAFAPARDRYKIFILDEAHMVTAQGFNALLKIVEEPPPHVKFIFATTEPDKVIGTIRSRTHHYPFRLVPPDVLGPYLEQLCAAEGVTIGSGVVPLVVRAGGGSVRDSLSVMDQLIAGAENGRVDHDRAVDLLGFTQATLLDDVVDALAVRDGASIFRVVEQVIATGHEPRRFVEDLLERLRDLIVMAVSGDAANAVLRDVPTDQLERMRAQATNLGAAELSRAADLVNAALTEMSGATSPRLHLELLCARLLLPGADDGAAGFAARLDRLERGGLGGGVPVAAGGLAGADASGVVSGGAGAPSGAAPSGAAAARAALRAVKPVADAPVAAPPRAVAVPEPAAAPETVVDAQADVPTVDAHAESVAEPEPVGPASEPEPAPEPMPEAAKPSDPAVASDDAAPSSDAVPNPDAAPSADSEPDAKSPVVVPAVAVVSSSVAAMDTEVFRRRWPEVLQTLSSSRSTWSLVSMNAQVAELTADVLYLAFPSPGLARAFSSARHIGAVQEAIYQTLGFQVRVEARLDEGPGTPQPGASGQSPTDPVPTDPTPPPPGAGSDTADTAVTSWAASVAATDAASTDLAGTEQAAWPEVAPTGSAASSEGASSPSTGLDPRPADGTERVLSGGGTAVVVEERPVAAPQAAVARAQSVARPAPAAPAPAAPAPTPPAPVVDAADEAWLAGVPVTEPPVDFDEGPEPEPAYEADVPASGARTSASSRPAPVQATPSPSSPSLSTPRSAAIGSSTRTGASTGASTTPAPGGVRETPRQAAERRVVEQQARQASSRASAPMDDDLPSADDPDLASSGLVGAPLVAKMLGGVVIDETLDSGI